MISGKVVPDEVDPDGELVLFVAVGAVVGWMIFLYSPKELVRKMDSRDCPDILVMPISPVDLSLSSLVVVLLILRVDFFSVAGTI